MTSDSASPPDSPGSARPPAGRRGVPARVRRTRVIALAAPVGRATVDLRSKWDTNGRKGGFDIHQTVLCEPKPAFTIEKLQSLGGPFTTETLSGAVGQTILYQMVVTNTGNTPLTF